MDGVGEGDERKLLQNFSKAHRVFSALAPQSQDVIMDITKRMAQGMAEFVKKDLGQGTADISQYNRYCHFVAGLVGEGLSRLFAASGLENESLNNEVFLSDQMGLFLQKTNIIRDYLEDYVDGRAFWPQSVWKKYSVTGDLGYFARVMSSGAEYRNDAKKNCLCCLNELVTDALELVPDCLTYLSKLETPEIFRFCAIPQVMAIATLDKCYDNLDVFTGVVKIRKGTSCSLIRNANNLQEVGRTFSRYAVSILQKTTKKKFEGITQKEEMLYERTIKACRKIIELTPNENLGVVRYGVPIMFGLLYLFGPWRRTSDTPLYQLRTAVKILTKIAGTSKNN